MLARTCADPEAISRCCMERKIDLERRGWKPRGGVEGGEVGSVGSKRAFAEGDEEDEDSRSDGSESQGPLAEGGGAQLEGAEMDGGEVIGMGRFAAAESAAAATAGGSASAAASPRLRLPAADAERGPSGTAQEGQRRRQLLEYTMSVDVMEQQEQEEEAVLARPRTTGLVRRREESALGDDSGRRSGRRRREGPRVAQEAPEVGAAGSGAEAEASEGTGCPRQPGGQWEHARESLGVAAAAQPGHGAVAGRGCGGERVRGAPQAEQSIEGGMEGLRRAPKRPRRAPQDPTSAGSSANPGEGTDLSAASAIGTAAALTVKRPASPVVHNVRAKRARAGEADDAAGAASRGAGIQGGDAPAFGRRYMSLTSDPVDAQEANGHSLRITGPMIWCATCGRYALRRVGKSLKNDCIGQATGAYATRLARLRPAAARGPCCPRGPWGRSTRRRLARRGPA